MAVEPNREYEAVAPLDPNWTEPEAMKYEALAVP